MVTAQMTNLLGNLPGGQPELSRGICIRGRGRRQGSGPDGTQCNVNGFDGTAVSCKVPGECRPIA